MLVSVLVGAFATAAILDLYLRKKFNIEKNEKFLDQFLSKGHMIFEHKSATHSPSKSS